jgi:hypothetical protein
MSALSISPPFPIFTETDGQPLENGYIWLGTINLNPIVNPISAYWDAALTIAAVQPIRTLNGYPVYQGTPARIYVNSDYSIQVQNRNGSVVYSAPAATERYGGIINASDVVYDPAGTGAVATTVQTKLRQTVSVFDFMTAAQIADVQAGTKLLTVTTALQAAADYAWNNGKILLIPAGTYKGKLTLPPAGTTEPRGDAFIMQGEGAGSVYLGGAPYIKGTTLVSPDTSPALNVTNVLTPADSGAQLHIRDIRFEANSTNPVVQFATWNDFCEMRNCELYQSGTGGGINMIRAYGGTIRETHIVNTNLVGTTSYTGTGISVGTPFSGALLTFEKVSVRGFNTGFSLGSGGGTYILNTLLNQCECAWNNYGIIVQAGMRKTVINACYFEEVQTVGIQDEGEGTTISNCFMFEGCATQIKGDYDTRGNLYFGNYIQLGGPNETGIAVKSSGDALGYAKTIRDNSIYFLNSGGTVAGVVGVYITGANPVLHMQDNAFRPQRAWVGGAGTAKVIDASTGYNTGVTPLTDTLVEVPFFSNINVGFVPSQINLTQANVSTGVLTLNASPWNTMVATSSVNITQINDGNKNNRLVMIVNENTNATFVKGTYMILASNFTGYGCIILQLTVIAGQTYAYEISRTLY